jgi:Protein of unknown function (DUF2695)
MPFKLGPSEIDRLIAFVDHRVQRDGCDHTLAFAEQWADQEGIDWHDVLDILQANGGHCDCEVVMNLPRDVTLEAPAPATPEPSNPWLLPTRYQCEPSAAFTKVIVCQADIVRNTYASDGEWLVPAPKGAKPRRRVRKMVNPFVGIQSGLPSEVGFIRECDPITAEDFACKVAQSGFEEFAAFTFREAGFVLSKIASIEVGKAVGNEFADFVGIGARRVELRIHRVIVTH